MNFCSSEVVWLQKLCGCMRMGRTSPCGVRSMRCSPTTCPGRGCKRRGWVGRCRVRKIGRRQSDCVCACVCWGVGWGGDLEAGEGRHEKLGLPRILGEETDGGAIVHLPIRINTQNMKEKKMFNRGAFDAPCQHANQTRIEKSKKKFTFSVCQAHGC
jgi:hypothetical protein